jgi:hypothetical protein
MSCGPPWPNVFAMAAGVVIFLAIFVGCAYELGKMAGPP